MFSKFKNKKENPGVTTQKSQPAIRTVYIMTFTAKEMSPDGLKSIVSIAERMLMGKDPAFARLWAEQMRAETMIEVANTKYAGPMMHTPQTMQAALASWIRKQYNEDYKPVAGVNFFPHGMKDPQGKENFVLFYFALEKS